MHRRKILVGSGVTLSTIIAGCAGDADDENGNESDGGNESEDDNGNGGTGDDNGDEPEEDTPEPDDEDADDGDDTDDEEEADDEDEQTRSDDDQLLSLVDTLEDADPLFDPDTQSFDGSGQTVTDEFSLEGGLTAVAFEHSGEANFIVNLEGPQEDLLVNEIGDIAGAAAVPTEGGDYLLDVDADGDWEITVGQPVAPVEELRTVPVEASGTGDAVVGPVELEEAITVEGDHAGDGNFIVTMYDEADSGGFASGELVFNQIGQFEGETRADYPGFVWIDVVADGDWSLALE